MDDHKPTRREFCTHAVSFVALGTLIESCGGSPTSPSNVPSLSTISATVSNNIVSINVDAASPLASVGSAALVQTSSGKFLVARTAQDTFTALSSVCTHEVCTISGYQSGTYVCPCHGSEFNTAGKVTRGPASSSLRQFPTQFANSVLTFSLV